MVRLLLGALVACLALAAAPAANASITLTYSGTTIGIVGTGDNATYIGFDSDASDVTVRNSTGVVNNSSCVAVANPPLGTYFHCPSAADTVTASYGGGTDLLHFEGVCVPTITAALGDGPGDFMRATGCPPDQVATVTGGSGEDWFVGGDGPDHFDGGDGPDHLRGGGGDDVLRGGAGNDAEIFGGDGNDTLSGEDGDDLIRGGVGNDTEDGGAGNDSFGNSDADLGADDIRGGPGFDLLDLDPHAVGAAISLDDVANDGTPGENDNYHSDLEKIYGTRGNDTYVGSAGNDVFDGGFGSDTARGGPGDDNLTGGTEADTLFGEGGNDTLYGGEGDDRVDGGPGTDSLFGDYSSCSAYGCSSGNDTILARDGEADAINCGAGADTAQIDAIDTLGQDGFQLCETVDRAAVPPPPIVTPAPTPIKAPGTSTTSSLQKATAKGGRRRVTLALTLKKAGTVTVTVTKVGAKKALGKVTFKAKAGKTTRTLRKVGRKTLQAGRYRIAVKVGKTTKTLTVRVT